MNQTRRADTVTDHKAGSRRRPRAPLLGLAALALLVLSACAQPPTDKKNLTDPFFLDTYGTSGIPTATGPVLASGVGYVVTVEGTHSSWGVEEWESGACKGTPAAQPMFPSPGTVNSFVGMDAVWVFAVPHGSSRCSNTVPFHGSAVRMSLNGGATFVDLSLLTDGAGPSADHSYEYEVTGQGQALVINRGSGNPSNNYGRLRIEVRQAE
ncbi:MAG TPA: hypothetical protein VFN03_12760 [Trueperaceae bacterium]|nr:hypothetical protein [Trueperaceae bacterium]